MATINETNRSNKNCQTYESNNYKQLRWKTNWTSLDSTETSTQVTLYKINEARRKQ